MPTFTYTDLMGLDLGKLGSAVTDWGAMVGALAELGSDASRTMVKLADTARWQGANATVTRAFVRSAAKEFTDLHVEAKSIHNVLEDAHRELVVIQKRAKSLTEAARAGAGKDAALVVADGGDGTVRVMEAVCGIDGTTQRTKDLMRWYAEAFNDLIAHAAEIDEAVVRALRRSHGGNPHDAGHATYTSLDEDQLPRAMKLSSRGDDASEKERSELRRLWRSLSPTARAELWKAHKDDLMDAGLLSPTVKKAAPDAGSGPHGVASPGWAERKTKAQMELIAEGADWKGMGDASRHMSHYLNNSGDDMNLPVDKMMSDDSGFRKHIDDEVLRHQDDWRDTALREFRRNGGRPVAIPVETANRDYSFGQQDDENWFFAVGSTRSNVTGVVTAVPGADGRPEVGLDYQANAWDRYNWDKGKGVDIGGMKIPDGQMGRLHTTGLAQEFDMAGSSSVKHYDLGGSTSHPGPLPGPDEPRTGRDGGRTDPDREQQQGRGNVYR
ncbi:hypothetical protein M1P56_33535 [Streptomyces sp. HU2014]|uniref:hypothetical protein n=1 Tax=Streptomyces sp. HU2014 TaxID=2939414 RepID=UPI00200DA28A|nr:hypothetical protein [Streptomyces sp. HU2014]UQI48888.1 hypothetical protein M1P56_33535 [Streptomyces sp. HU2014]